MWLKEHTAIRAKPFIYDGWNLLAELDGGAPLDPLPLVRSYAWGLDLADSFEEAGGIGGLLLFTDHTPLTDTYYYPTYDGNGNVTGLVQSSGSPSALYEYSPFGELIRSTGPSSRLNPFQFSTKYLDQETGLSYYGHRYYSASLGRWIGRDPIEEEDGPNVYAFVRNGAINFYDLLGLNNLIEVEGTQAASAKAQSDGWMTLRKIYSNAQEFQQNAADFADMWNLVMDSVQGDPSDLIMEIVNARRDIARIAKDPDGPKHHRLPQRMREIFARARVEIDRDKFVKGVSAIVHRRLHGGKGFDGKLGNKTDLGMKGGMWNFMWRAFMGKESNRTDAKAIEEFSNRMVSFFGI